MRNLAIAAGALVIATIWVGGREQTVEFPFSKGQLLLPDVDAEKVAEIEVQNGTDKVVLKRAGAQYLVESEKNYPASTREVNDLLGHVLGIRLEAEATTDKDAYAPLGVAGGEDAKSTTVKLSNAEGKELVTVITGKSEKDQQFVRLGSGPKVFRAEEALSLRTKGLDYVDKQLVQLNKDDIAKVVVAPAGGKVYTINSPEKGKTELADIPEGKKVKSYEPDSVFNAANYLSFEKFSSAADMKDLAFDNAFTVTTRAGAEYRFDLAKKDDKWYLRGSANYVGPAITEQLVLAAKGDEAKNKEIEQNRLAAAAAETFNQKHQSWVYEIGTWKATPMTKAFDELVVADDGKPEKVSASHILIPWKGCERAPDDITRTKDEAQALAEKLLAEVRADPAKLPELAKDNSSCPSKDKGGDLGEFGPDAMAKPFSDAAFALKVGEVCDHIVETQFGYHIIERTK
ncbi:MAG: peptidylprolyl isomerase [Planctomycetota bacterium]